MRIRHQARHHPPVMMSRTLDACWPEYIDTLPPIAKLYRLCEYRTYVNDILAESNFEMPFEEAMEKGKAAFEAAKAAGGPIWTEADSVRPVHRRGHAPIVYYMRMSDLVKIGTTVAIRSRFDTIRPQGVMAVEWGGHQLERQRHNQFAHLHSHGEWFTLTPELVDHIFALRESFRDNNGEGIDQWLKTRLPAAGDGAKERALKDPPWC